MSLTRDHSFVDHGNAEGWGQIRSARVGAVPTAHGIVLCVLLCVVMKTWLQHGLVL